MMLLPNHPFADAVKGWFLCWRESVWEKFDSIKTKRDGLAICSKESSKLDYTFAGWYYKNIFDMGL